MTKVESQFPFETQASWTRLGLVGAILLILLGVVLQLNVLGYGHFDADSFWFITVIAEGVWNVLAVRMDMPALGALLRFWPLVFVSSGLMILMSLRAARTGGALVLSRETANSRTEGRKDA